MKSYKFKPRPLKDLFPCGEPKDDCVAALWMPCNDCNPDFGGSHSYCEKVDGCYYVPVKYGVRE